MRDLLKSGWMSSSLGNPETARRSDMATHGRVRRVIDAVRARRERRRKLDQKSDFRQRLLSVHIASATVSRGNSR